MEKCQNKCKAAVIIGGGLLGLEAAKACYDMAVPEVHVLQNSSRLMSRQLDQAGGDLLKRKIEELAQAPQSIHVHCSSQTKQITVNDEGEVCGVSNPLLYTLCFGWSHALLNLVAMIETHVDGTRIRFSSKTTSKSSASWSLSALESDHVTRCDVSFPLNLLKTNVSRAL
eukprot:SAG31_NODE_89_length_26711_cov_24.949459_3_plen_170_part_00